MKNVKRNVIVSAMLAIALCMSVIAGATFAMFGTDNTTNIMVTTANINVAAEAKNVKTYSVTEDGTEIATSDNTFTNGGTAKIDTKKGNVTLDKLTAGDRVEFDLVVKNKSNVTVKYRTVVRTSASDTVTTAGSKAVALMLALDVKTQVEGEAEKDYNGWTYESDWKKLDAANSADGDELKVVHVSIGLPATATDASLLNSKLNIAYKIEAVQGNAPTEDAAEDEYRIYNEFDLRAFGEMVRQGNDFAGKTVKVMEWIYGSNYPMEPIGDSAHPFKGTFIGAAKSTSKGRTVLNGLNIVTRESYGGGLFARLGEGAIVKDIEFRSGSVQGSGNSIDETNKKFSIATNIVGAIAGYTSGNVTLENIDIGGVYVYGCGKVGGVVGMNESGSKLTLKDVEVWGTYIRGAYNVSGLVGLSLEGAPTVSGDTKVSKTYTVDRIIITGGEYVSGGSYVDLDTTLADDTTKIIKGKFLRSYDRKTGKYYIFAIQSNLYIVKGSVYENKMLPNGDYVGDSAIVNDEGFVNGVENNGVYKLSA